MVGRRSSRTGHVRIRLTELRRRIVVWWLARSRSRAPGQRAGRDDRGVHEPCGEQLITVLRGGESAHRAADGVFGLGTASRVEAGLGQDVADAETTIGPQDSGGLGQRAGLLGGQREHAVGDDHVHRGTWLPVRVDRLPLRRPWTGRSVEPSG